MVVCCVCGSSKDLKEGTIKMENRQAGRVKDEGSGQYYAL